jgi:hypothetical protein
VIDERGIGIMLINPNKALGGFRESFPEALFDADKVHDSFKAIFTQ